MSEYTARILRPNIGLSDQLPKEFLKLLGDLNRKFAEKQQILLRLRRDALAASHIGSPPTYAHDPLPPFMVEVPGWCEDQRNQMTVPADDAAMVVKALNSGSPGVMLDLEDSIVNDWEHLMLGHKNIIDALAGRLAYFDKKQNRSVGIDLSATVVWTRVRGLHIHQYGILGEPVPAPMFDVLWHAYLLSKTGVVKNLKHSVCFYLPKSESAIEAIWWHDIFEEIRELFGWDIDAIKCMALVESHPLACEMDNFIYELKPYIVGLNLGRWDYMASLIHFMMEKKEWVLPDRDSIPHDVPFFQNLRKLMVEICHRRGILAIGGMTALFPDKNNPLQNMRAMKVLMRDKKNEADVGMDGAWTGHPRQNAIAVGAFPAPNQLHVRYPDLPADLDLRPVPTGSVTEEGTRAAIRTVIQYRAGVDTGFGASLIRGRMEDLATDRIYRLMIAQRVRHGVHRWEEVNRWFEEELRLLQETAAPDMAPKLWYAWFFTEQLIIAGEFDPH